MNMENGRCGMLCDFCIEVMIMLSRNWGVTYGTANVVLFVILMPNILSVAKVI